jgi:TP901-1 family phage major tail protein
MAGELNGTNVFLAVDNGGVSIVGGLLTNSFTLNNGSIDITNKSNSSWRTLLAGEGLQSVDISGELIFNDSVSFAFMKTSADTKTLETYNIARGSEVMAGTFYITSWAEAAPDNDKLTVSVSLQSSGAVTGI